MPDDFTGGAVSLEPTEISSGPPVAAPAAPPTPPPAEPAPVAAAADDDGEPEGVQTDAAGNKYVPFSHLQAVRAKQKADRAALNTAQTRVAEADALESRLDQMRPLLARLAARPDIVQALMRDAQAPVSGAQVAAPQPEGPLEPAEAEALAVQLELYGPDGKPDTGRAQKVGAMLTRMATQQAQQAVAPVAQTIVEGQAGTLKAQYKAMKDRNGRQVNPQVFDKMWEMVDPKLYVDDPNSAGIVFYAAHGYAAFHGLDNPLPAPNMPLVTEPAGGAPRTAAQTLSALDQQFARHVGGEKNYRDTAGRFQPGRINVLED